MNKKFWFILISLIAAGREISIAQVNYLGNKPGGAISKKVGGSTTLENNIIEMAFWTTNGHLTVGGFYDKQNNERLPLSKNLLFSLSVGQTEITSNDFVLTGSVSASEIKGDDKAIKGADKLDGKKLSADLENKKEGLHVHWEASLLDGANYIRQELTFNTSKAVKVTKITLVQLPAAIKVKKEGIVDGSPLVHNNMFFALEHPMSQTGKSVDHSSIFIPRLNAIEHDAPLTLSSAWGVTPAGQLRRGFLYYIERERAQPYHQMLHYNSWFDISYDTNKLNDSLCLDRIKAFKDSFIDKRQVNLKAFLFDDGWDDNKTLWQFNAGFPDGFNKVRTAANEAHSTVGVWISPWGGYNEPKEQRIAYGKKQDPPFETNENGFSLTGPVYYNRFRAVTTNFIKNYGVSIFKFDGVGAGNGASGASITYQKDIEAFLKLITGLRTEKPDLYLSLTVGTWPSVYWLNYGDAIWRAGDDTGLDGEGPKREKWITYKDGQAYKNIVKRAPLYPLNSVMYHGICIADKGLPGELEMDDKSISDEIWMFFGSGTSLQELYVNPHKLNTADWDCLKYASDWSALHAKALDDTHWVGGDPAKGNVYGYAGWADQHGVLTLRNPTSRPQTYTVNVKNALDIPEGLNTDYKFYDMKASNHPQVYEGKSFVVTLVPFEVKVMDASEK